MTSPKQHIIILGAGESGTGAAILARVKGYDVFVSDSGTIANIQKKILNQHNIEYEQGSHSLNKILKGDLVVTSPGIPLTSPVIKAIKAQQIPVISEIEFAYQNTKAGFIAITGTNGKTTTTLLTWHILKQAGLNVGLAGNIGKSLAYQVATQNYDWYVVELSSFQLDTISTFKPHIAIILNISQDHLDRYPDYQAYGDSKFRIAKNQLASDHLIYNSDDHEIQQRIANLKAPPILYPITLKETPVPTGGWCASGNLIIKTRKDLIDMNLEKLALQGKHNTYNSMAAGIAARLVEIRKQNIKESLSDFQHIEHRLEFVAKIHGIEFINDSKATNINSTWYALESMNAKVIWIVGGIDKGNDYSKLKSLVREKVKSIVCLGIDNQKIIDAFTEDVKTITQTSSAKAAVSAAYAMAEKEDIVLLSPACASFDIFNDYQDRGNQFKDAVHAL